MVSLCDQSFVDIVVSCSYSRRLLHAFAQWAMQLVPWFPPPAVKHFRSGLNTYSSLSRPNQCPPGGVTAPEKPRSPGRSSAPVAQPCPATTSAITLPQSAGAHLPLFFSRRSTCPRRQLIPHLAPLFGSATTSASSQFVATRLWWPSSGQL